MVISKRVSDNPAVWHVWPKGAPAPTHVVRAITAEDGRFLRAEARHAASGKVRWFRLVLYGLLWARKEAAMSAVG